MDEIGEKEAIADASHRPRKEGNPPSAAGTTIGKPIECKEGDSRGRTKGGELAPANSRSRIVTDP
jgi:hypothetical protein